MQKNLIVGLVISLSVSFMSAQESKKWTLQECISYSQTNNLSVKRQQLDVEYKRNEVNRSKFDMIPSVNAQSSYNAGFGRYLDRVDNVYLNQTTQSINGGIGADVVIFKGLIKQNALQQTKYDLLASLEDVKKVENDITLAITSQFLQILFDQELLNVAKEQYQLTQLQADRTKKLVDAGSVARGNFLELKSQLAKEALSVTTQENSLVLSKLNLGQLLDLPDAGAFEISIPELPVIDAQVTVNADNVYQNSLTLMPQIKSSEYQLQSNVFKEKIAKGYMMPSLSAGGGWNTQANLEGAGLGSQLKNNTYSSVGLTLNIPIFNGHNSHLNAKNAKIRVLDSEYQLQSEKLQLQKDIQQAYADAIASYKKYLSSNEAVVSYEESFRYTEQKFNVGVVSSVDYNLAKTELLKAKSSLLQAKYEYILRNKILDFYNGNPIVL